MLLVCCWKNERIFWFCVCAGKLFRDRRAGRLRGRRRVRSGTPGDSLRGVPEGSGRSPEPCPETRPRSRTSAHGDSAAIAPMML